MPSPKKIGKLAPIAPRVKKIEYFTEQRFTKLSKKGNVLQLLRQQTGDDGHENIASFVEKKYGADKEEIMLMLDKISTAFTAGNISFSEKDRLKGLILSNKNGVETARRISAAFPKEMKTCQICAEAGTCEGRRGRPAAARPASACTHGGA